MDATDLCFAGAAEQARLVAAGEVSARELVEATLERIEALTPRSTPSASCCAERALDEADQADARRRAGDERPLLGVPGRDQGRRRRRRARSRPGAPRAHGPAKEHDAEVVRAPARGGRDRRRQDARPELTMLPFTEYADVRRHPQPVGRSTAPRAGRAAAPAPPWPPGWSASRSAPTAAARSASRPRGAACSASSRSATACRSAPHDDAWHGLSVSGPLARRVADAALFLERRGAAAARLRRRGRARAAGACGSRSAPRRRPGRSARLGREQRAGGRGHRRRSCARSATTSSSARPTTGRRSGARTCAALPARDPRRRRTAAAPRAPRGRARASDGALGGLISGGQMRRVHAAEADLAARIDEMFERRRRRSSRPAALEGRRSASARSTAAAR